MADDPLRNDAAGNATPSRVASTLGAIGILLVLVATSVGFCWMPAWRVWSAHVVEGWPVVDATVVSARVARTHQPRIGKRSSWNGWCVSWDYSYDWQGGLRGGNVGDTTPSTLSAGCFTYRESAERAATRRSPGSTLPVHVDPDDRWHSIAGPVGPRTADIVALILGAIPAAMAIYLGCRALRHSSKRA